MRNRASPRRRTPQFCSKRTTSTTGLHRSKGDENDTGLLSESMLQAKSSIDHSWICVLLTFAALFIPHSKLNYAPCPGALSFVPLLHSEWAGEKCSRAAARAGGREHGLRIGTQNHVGSLQLRTYADEGMLRIVYHDVRQVIIMTIIFMKDL